MNVEPIKRRFGIIGNDPMLLRAIEVAYQVAPTDLSVLVTGESGTGKEYFPKIVHQFSARKHGQYIAVNCGAIPEGTIDSELFGHVKGSFTGALDDRKGYFEVADRGTIFLDEVAELPLSTQARLLRVLESGEYLKVGSSVVQKTDIRVIAATNENLPRAIEQGKFREDLFYRLATVPIQVPPLRERGRDMLLLFSYFANEFAEKYKMPAIALDAGAEQALREYRWPGNVRQLKNVTEQISIIETERTVDREVLLRYLPARAPGMLPTLYQNQEVVGMTGDRELLYGLVRDMRREVNDLKLLVVDLLRTASHGAASQEQLSAFAQRHAQQLSRLAPQVPGASTGGTPGLITPPIVGLNTVGAPMPTRDIGGAAVSAVREEQEVEPILQTLPDLEEEMIRQALVKNKGHRRRAAHELGISERTLYRKLKDLNL